MRAPGWIFAGMIGCGSLGRGEPDAEPVQKPWVKSVTAADPRLAAVEARETQRFVASSGAVDVAFELGRRKLVGHMLVEKSALKVGDVPTLEHVIGYVKFDTTTFTTGDEITDKVLQSLVLRDLGAPVHIVFDANSVGSMVGRLSGDGSTATGEILGTLQFDTRQFAVDLPARFRRVDAAHIEVQMGPFDLDLKEYAVDRQFNAAAVALGERTIGTTVTVSGTLSLEAFTDENAPMPGFVRTPLTVNTVDELRAIIDRDVDNGEATRMQLLAAGLPEGVIGGMSAERLREVDRYLREAAAVRDGKSTGSVLDNPAQPADGAKRPADKPKTRTVNGVEIRD